MTGTTPAADGPVPPGPPHPPLHLDAATREPLHPAAREALLVALDEDADPSRRYTAGRRARLRLDAAREVVAGVLGVRPDEVLFSAGGGPLASTLAVLGLLGARRRVGDRVVHSAVEHSAVLHAARTGTAVEVPVDARGRVDAVALSRAAAAPGTALACLQSANGEVGTVQPAVDPGEVPLLVDATASLGLLPLPERWSVVTADSGVLGGPAGVGVLVLRTGTRFRAPLPGEDRVPAAPLPLVVATAVALHARAAEAAGLDARLRPLVERLRTELPRRVPDLDVLGDPVDRLPHVLTVSCLYVDGESLSRELDAAGLAVSSGSACTSSTLQPSHVLAAMGALTSGSVRLSLTRDAAPGDVERVLEVLPAVVARLRREAGVEGL